MQRDTVFEASIRADIFPHDMMSLHLALLPTTLSVCRLSPSSLIPDWATRGRLFAITRTPNELSIVCSTADVPGDVQAAHDWRALEVAGPLEFSLTGVLSSLVGPLADAGVSVFAFSTYDTDYLLVRSHDLDRAVETLRAAGHGVEAV